MRAEEKVLDRIEQSFEIFRKGLVYLVVPFFVYYLFSFIFFSLIAIYLLFSGILLSIFDTMNYDNFFMFFTNVKVVLLVTLCIFFGLIYLLLYIPFFIYAIKTIGDFYKGVEKINFKENFMYSINRFFLIMKTYWYIFAYVALIPSLIFIVGGVIFNLGYFFEWDDIYIIIGGSLMGIGIFLFIAFSIYRGLKTSFSTCSAVDSDDFSRENFAFSLSITSNKWWRILGNMIFIGLIVGLLSSIASNMFAIFFSNSSNLSNIFNDFNNKDLVNDFNNKDLVNDLILNFSFFNYFVSGLLEIFISTIGKVFILIFIYIFYKRLSFETTNNVDMVEEKEEKVLKNQESKTVEL